MTITLNGESREFDREKFSLVTELLAALGLDGQPVLVELNGQALLKQEFEKNEINEGDQVEIIRMVAGG